MKKLFLYMFLCSGILFTWACQEDAYEPELFGALFGDVFIASDGTPLANVTISTNPPTSTTLTDAAGRFSLENIAASTYSIRAEKEGFLTSVESVTIYGNQSSNVVINLSLDTLNSEAPSPAFDPFPETNSVDQTAEITLSWSATDPEEDALLYDVTMYTADASDPILVAEQTTETSVDVSLMYDQTYFWQVVVYDDVNDPVYSEVWQFTTESLPDHRFLFARSVDNKYEIFSSDELNNTIQLTNNSGNNWRPRMNPERNKIAYISDVGIESHIFIMNRDGSDAYQVTSVPIAGINKLELDFSWSPDGSQLLYMNNASLYRINIDGSGLELFLTAGLNLRFIECDWTAQGNLIAARTVSADPYDSFISIYDQNGGFLTQVLNNPLGGSGGPVFSISGASVLYTHDVSGYEGTDGRQLDSRVFIRSLSNSQIVDVSINKVDGTNDLDARFSPDGASVIFVNTNNDGISQQNILKVGLNGANRELLFENAITPEWK